MNNIEEYRKRFYNLMESTIGDAKPLISEDFDNIDYGRTKNGLGPDNEELEEDMIDDEDEDFDDEDEDFDDEDEDFDDDSRLQDNFDDIDSSYDSIENMINDALSNLSPEEQEELLERVSDLVEGLKSNDEDEDEDDEDEDDESYLNEDYDSEAILNPTSIKYSKNPKVDDFLESVFPRLDTEETKNAFRKLLHNEELFKDFSRLMRMFGYNSYHNKEEIFDKVIEWANERGNDEDRGNDEEIW
jgi:hypothetical protein